MKTLRIDHVVVATPDARGAQATFRNLFGLAARTSPGGGDPALEIGSARIDFVTPTAGTPLATAFAASGEGMMALCLEVADLDQAAVALERGQVPFTRETIGVQRVIQVDPGACHGVRLSLLAHV